MSENEKYKIRRRYSNLARALLGVILAYIIISAFVFKKVTPVYNVVIVVGLFLFWLIMDVAAPIKAHEFEDKTPEQMSAYKKYAAADLLGYGGLMYFALAMTSNTGIYGALVYLAGRMLKNKFKEEYEGTADDDADEDEPDGEIVADIDPDIDGVTAETELLTENVTEETVTEDKPAEE